MLTFATKYQGVKGVNGVKGVKDKCLKTARTRK